MSKYRKTHGLRVIWNSSPDSPDSPDRGHGVQLGTPFHTRRKVKITSVLTNSLKLSMSCVSKTSILLLATLVQAIVGGSCGISCLILCRTMPLDVAAIAVLGGGSQLVMPIDGSVVMEWWSEPPSTCAERSRLRQF